MNWKLCDKDIWLKVDFDTKDKVKEKGAQYDGDKKRWFIPRGSNPLNFRDYWRVLECPFDQKETVKRMGAKWDPSLKKWFVPANLDFDDFARFWPKDLQKFIFDDRFVAYEEITSGQSTVFKSWDQKNSGWFAVKLYPSISDDKNKSTAFNRELKHLMNVLEGIPSVLPIESWNRHDSSSGNFYVTEWVELGTLSEYIGNPNYVELMVQRQYHGELEEETFEEIVSEIRSSISGDPFVDSIMDIKGVLESLVQTYSKGVIHRDIKPDNIYLKLNPELLDLSEEEIDQHENPLHFVLGDFGSSKLLEDSLSGETKTTVNLRSEPWGPERSKLEKQYQETWDVYSWAVLVIALVVDKKFKTDEDLQLAKDGDFKSLVPDNFFSIIEKCLHDDPSERYQNVLELAEAVRKSAI